MTIFNAAAVIKKIEDKRVFIADAAKSVAKQQAAIANVQEKLSGLTLVHKVDDSLVDMGAMAESIFERADKKITTTDKVVFSFFGVPLKNTAKTLTSETIEELLKAKKERLDRDAELKTQYTGDLSEQRGLLATIEANKLKAENELAETIENLPESVAAALHSAAKAVCEVYGKALSLEYDDILKRVETSYFEFNRKEGKRINVKPDLEGLKTLAALFSAMRMLRSIHSGMKIEQRAALFEAFDKASNGLFNAGELPSVNSTPVQAAAGFSGEAAHAVPKEPVFKSLASYFNKVDGELIVNCVDGIDVINELVKRSNENRGWSILKSVKEYRKNPQDDLIEVIDNFDIIMQGYLCVAMQEFVLDGTHSQLDRLFSSPTMVNAGQLTPYGRQVKTYLSCVMPYITLKHRGDGSAKTYFFEAVKSSRYEKLGLSPKVGFYTFGARAKAEKDGQMQDARLPQICIRSHFVISKALRDLKRADDARAKEAHAKEWSEYRDKYGLEYTKHTLQSEIDSLTALLSSKAKELANL